MAKYVDVYNFHCKVFEPAIAHLSKKDLEAMLLQLYDYFPFTNRGDGNKEPHETTSDYTKKWFNSYNHLLMLIETRTNEEKYNFSVKLSVLAVIISVISVLVNLYINYDKI
ncbi:hypothetical protein AAFM81_002534 [Vibrio fluvialis]